MLGVERTVLTGCAPLGLAASRLDALSMRPVTLRPGWGYPALPTSLPGQQVVMWLYQSTALCRSRRQDCPMGTHKRTPRLSAAVRHGLVLPQAASELDGERAEASDE